MKWALWRYIFSFLFALHYQNEPFFYSATVACVGCSHFKDLFLRTHRRLSTILKTSNESAGGNIFWYVKVCIFWKCIQYTIHWDKKISFGQNQRYKKCPLFSFVSSSQFHHSFMSWITIFVSLKVCDGFSIFDSVLFLLKFIFLLSKINGLFDFKT